MEKIFKIFFSHSFSFFFIFLGIVSFMGCPSSLDSQLDTARFALDHCNPSDSTTNASCQQAVDEANAALVADPGNVEAAILSSSGYLGLAGIDFLQFASKLVDVENNASTEFKQFQTLVSTVESTNSRSIDISPLLNASSVLSTTLAGKSADSDLNKRAFFQLGAIQSIDVFVRPVKLLSYDASNHIDLNQIDDAAADLLKQQFIDSDDNLSSGGTTDDKTLKASREGYCRCKLQTRLGGYTAACVRDLLRCELSNTETEDTEQDYDGDGTVVGDRVHDCDALINPPGKETCKDQNSQ